MDLGRRSRRGLTRHHRVLSGSLRIATISGSLGLGLWLGVGGVRRGVAGQPLFDLRDGCFKALSAKGAFPDDSDTPTGLQEPGVVPLVPGHRGRELGVPEMHASLGCRGVLAALVAVPEAAVDEADRAVLGEDEIRPSRQPLAV